MIDIGACYEVYNGLTGMMRDVLLLLCRYIEKRAGMESKEKDQCIRRLFGMCQEHMKWKTHLLFLDNRLEFIKELAKSFEVDSYEFVSLSNSRCMFKTPSLWHSIFVNYAIAEGIYKICYRIIRFKLQLWYPYDFAMFGVCPESKKDVQRNTYLGSSAVPGSCGIYIGYNYLRTNCFSDKETSPSDFSYKVGTVLAVLVSAYGSPEFEISSITKLTKSSVPQIAALTAVTLEMRMIYDNI